MFEAVDDDGNGTLDEEEFAQVLELLGSPLPASEVALTFAEIVKTKSKFEDDADFDDTTISRCECPRQKCFCFAK